MTMNGQRITVTFTGERRSASVEPGTLVLRAARNIGIEIVSTCGGRGRCRSCRVKLVSGTPPPPTLADMVQLGAEEVGEGYRLACQFAAAADATIQIAPPHVERAFQILEATGENRDAGRLTPDSGVSKARIFPSALEDEVRTATQSIPLSVLRQMPRVLEEVPDGVTVTRFAGRVMALEAGDTTGGIYGIAFDIGTTTVVGYLLDLTSGEVLATVSGLNPQSALGGDLISRIGSVMEDAANLRRMRTGIVSFANDLIGQACADAGVKRNRIYKVVVVGNTCMHHLFLGIDPTSVGRAPYTPVISHAYSCAAREAGLRANAEAGLFLLPLVAGFVGADTVAMILSTGIHDSEELRAVVDIGTNAEVVMGGRDRLVACSSPAGPALEGGQIRDGMRAAMGAIDRVRLGDDIELHTIGEAPPLGICGSGLIDAAAALLDAGILAPSGRLPAAPERPMPASLRARIREGPDGVTEFVLAWAKDSGTGKDIVLSQLDIRQLQLAKAAILSGLEALGQVMGVGEEGVAELMLAGGFGNYLNLDSARRIGMIPDLPPERVRYVANAAGLGAQMALVSEAARERAGALARRVEHISLADHPDFQKTFLDALPFPEPAAEGVPPAEASHG